MADAEKIPVEVTEPQANRSAPEAGTIFGLFKGTTVNDPNVLGKDLLKRALEFDEAQLERDAVKVRKKLDFMVLPMV